MVCIPILQCNRLSKEHNGGHQLDKEARKWATKIAKESRSLRQNRKTLQALENQYRGDRVNKQDGESQSLLSVTSFITGHWLL